MTGGSSEDAARELAPRLFAETDVTASRRRFGPDMGTRILVVDDDDQVRGLLRRILSRDGYLVGEATSVDHGLAWLRREGVPAMVISDLHMPDRDGIDFLRELRRRYPDVGVMMVTGDGDIATAVECLKLGASDYLSKPIDVDVVRARVAKTLTELDRMLEVRELRESYHEELRNQVQALSQKNAALFIAHIQMAVTMLEARDPYTRGHSQRVARYAVAIGTEMALEPEVLAELQLGGDLHDIGKIGTRDSILWKSAALTNDEMTQVRRHTTDGVAMLAILRDDHPAVLQMVRSHHERFDGTGFPDGLAGTMIPLAARIVCVADSYDAMTSTRPYRDALPAARALAELERGAGTQFDPTVVAAFRAAFPDGPPLDAEQG